MCVLSCTQVQRVEPRLGSSLSCTAREPEAGMQPAELAFLGRGFQYRGTPGFTATGPFWLLPFCLPKESIINPQQSTRKPQDNSPFVLHYQRQHGPQWSSRTVLFSLLRVFNRPSLAPVTAAATELAARLGKAGSDRTPCPGPSGGFACTRSLFRGMNTVCDKPAIVQIVLKSFSKHNWPNNCLTLTLEVTKPSSGKPLWHCLSKQSPGGRWTAGGNLPFTEHRCMPPLTSPS